jgi:site-specific DNA recombinase
MNLQGKRVAVYARYSTDQQSEASIADQVDRCVDYVRNLGGHVANELVFFDAAMSGTNTQRPAFERMMQHARSKKVDVIVAEDMSRLSRDLADSAHLFKELSYLAVTLLGVADGIDSSARGAKMNFTLKSLMSDVYIDDLRDKTQRGLNGRARAGFSTGGLPMGYRSEPETSPDGRVIGNRILIDEERAAVVRDIFAAYVGGESRERIAHRLNREHVEPARRGRYKNKGWTAETVRSILRNKAYTGEWTYGRREWMKVPGTNKRRPRPRAPNQWIVNTFPERRIVDARLWAEAQIRAAKVSAYYAPKSLGPQTFGVPGKRSSYPLSGILRCGSCGSVMIIAGGSSASYYRCRDNKKKGICSNAVTVREDLVRDRILGEVARRFSSPDAVTYLRKRLGERLGEMGRELAANVNEVAARVARTKLRIANVIAAIQDGNTSRALGDTLKDLEAQQERDEREIGEATARAKAPIHLPSPDELVRKAKALAELIAANPTQGREALMKLFAREGIKLTADDRGIYTAKSVFFPLGLLGLGGVDVPSGNGNEKTRHPIGAPGSRQLDTWSSAGCAGRI